MSREARVESVKIDLWESKVIWLREKIAKTDRSPWGLSMHLRSELWIYGTLLAIAKDDLQRAQGRDTSIRDDARTIYLDVLERTEPQLAVYADWRNRSFVEAFLQKESLRQDALCAWIDA
jgi:hypothetical protein